MNIYDTANKLAKEIKKSKEYVEYKKSKELMNSNYYKKDKIKEFEKLMRMTQLNEIKNNEINEENRRIIQEKYGELLKDAEMKKYFEAEFKFNVMIADINKIIAEAVNDIL